MKVTNWNEGYMKIEPAKRRRHCGKCEGDILKGTFSLRIKRTEHAFSNICMFCLTEINAIVKFMNNEGEDYINLAKEGLEKTTAIQNYGGENVQL